MVLKVSWCQFIIFNFDHLKYDNYDLERIILCDVQNDIYPDLEKSLLDVLHNSGYQNIKFNKKIDFENLYQKKIN